MRGAFPDDLSEVAPFREVGHVRTGLAIEAGEVWLLIGVHHLADDLLANLCLIVAVCDVLTVGSAGGRNGTSNVRTIVFQTTKWRNTYVSCSYTQREARVWAACARSSDQVKALAEWSLR